MQTGPAVNYCGEKYMGKCEAIDLRNYGGVQKMVHEEKITSGGGI